MAGNDEDTLEKPDNCDRNRDIINQLKNYIPEGCIQEGDHIPVKGKGCWYQDANGKKYLDFSSGIFTNSFGHGCDGINMAGYRQAELLSNIHGRHSQAELLFFKRLFLHLPADDYKAIPYNDGGYTIDRGITDIINYFNKQRIGIGAFRGGFHGKTQAVKLLINETEKAAFYDNFQIDFPYCYRCPFNKKKDCCNMECAEEACSILKERQAGAIVFEPVQGSGIVIPPKGYWEKMQDFCRSRNILMFADEVLTGGGRVGSYLASTYFKIVPDMIALTKGLANGKPLSVLLEREYITKNRFAARPLERSSTFAAHPESLAVAAELLNLLDRDNVIENVQVCGKILEQGLIGIAERFGTIGETRCIGLMAAVEFVKDKESRLPFTQMGKLVFQKCRKNGLETIESGHILRLAPPLIISKADLISGLEILEKSIAEAECDLRG